MTPKDQNILSSLNLLVLLYRSNKRALPPVSEQEQGTLNITDELLKAAQISLPVFVNSLDHLSEKGYLFYFSPFAQKARDELVKYKDEPVLPKLIDELKAKDTTEDDRKLRGVFVEIFEKMAPRNISIDIEGFMNDDEVTVQGMLQEVHEGLLKYTPDIVVSVLLMPFRSIERLYDKMSSGMPFDAVQDAGLWYDPRKYEFHYGEQVASTAYRGTATFAHDVLNTLFNSGKDRSVVDYSDVSGFAENEDVPTAKKRYRDSMAKFLKKDPKLSEIFAVLSDRVEISREYLGDVH